MTGICALRRLSDVSNRREADIADCAGYVAIGRIARLPGSPREGPEYAPKPPFHRRREIGFAAQTGHKGASAVGVIDSPQRRFLLAGNLGVAQIRGLVHSHPAKVGSRRGELLGCLNVLPRCSGFQAILKSLRYAPFRVHLETRAKQHRDETVVACQ
jgi:hypothetical protein